MAEKIRNLGLVIASLLILVLLSSIILVREFGGSPPYQNGASYYNLRIASEVADNPFLEKDPVQDRQYSPNAYHYFLAFLLNTFGEQKTIYLAPVLMGLVSALLFYSLLVTLGFPKANASFSMLLLAMTPAFISTYSALSEHGFAILLSLSALMFYFEKTYWEYPWKASGKIFFASSAVSIALLLLTSITGFVITLMFLLTLSIFKSRNIMALLLVISPSIILLIPLAVFTSYPAALIINHGFQYFAFREIFSIFGARLGFDLFLVLLFLTGLVLLWSYFRELRIYHLLAILFLLVSCLNPLARVYASLVVTVYCVFAIKHLYYRQWEQEVIKLGTVMLLICALVFSALNQVTAIVNAEPGPEAKEMMLSMRTLNSTVILTDAQYGFAIQYFSGKKTLLDENSHLYPGFYDLLGDYEYILRLTPLREVEPMFIKHNVSHVLITPAMKEELWNGREVELILLLRHSGTFENIRETESGFELWAYNWRGQKSN